MTREQIKQLFPDATDEQITKLLNQHNQEIGAERIKTNSYKEKAEKADALQTQIDQLQNGSNSEVEKLQQKVAELEKAKAISETKKSAMAKFKIDAEQAEKVIREDGSLDFDALGKIMSEKESAAAAAKEQEIASKAGNPGGGAGNPGNPTDQKSEPEKIAEQMLTKKGATANVVDKYIRQ